MTEKQIIASEKELQNYFRIHPRLNLEFKALMSRLLREHRIDVTPETLSRLTVSLDRTGADAEVEPADYAAPIPQVEREDVSLNSNYKEPASYIEPAVNEAEADDDDDWEPELDADLDGEAEPEGVPK